MSIVDDIKAQVDLAELVSETASVKLKKSGKGWVGFCPFHDDRKKPSLVVYPPNARGQWYWKCFSCNDGGSQIDWVMKKNPGWDVTEAIKSLAKRAGIELESDGSDISTRVAAQRKRSAYRVAMDVFKRWLLGVYDKAGKQVCAGDAAALSYAMDRGWDVGTIQNGGTLGFSGRATAEEYREMRGELQMNGIDLLSPEAVVVLGFRGDTAEWAKSRGLDPKSFGENYISGLMDKPALVYAHKFEGRIEYFSGRILPGFDEKRKSHNPNAGLAGERRSFRNSLYRHHHLDGQDKGALLYIVEGQGDAKTCEQFGVPAVALCGSSWEYLVESGEVEDWKGDYEEFIYVTDADAAGEKVVTGKDNRFDLSSALGAMLWVGRTPNLEWTRPDGAQKSVKDLNDLAQYLKDTKAERTVEYGLFNEISMKAERIVVLAARYAGTLNGHPKDQLVEKVMRPMILSIPTEKRVGLTRDLAVAMYPNGSKASSTTSFNQWLRAQEKSAEAAADDKEYVPTHYINYGQIKNPKDPNQYWVVDMIFNQETQKAMLAYRNDQGEIGLAKSLDIYGERYYPRVDDFVRKGIVVFASDLGPLVSTRELLREHEAFLRRSVLFDKGTDYAMASFYSVFSWVYDCFNELPFLRARGGKDTGKSAIMLRIGYLCYRLAKSTGIGSTASLKHAQEAYHCTIFFDEMDIADKFDERIVMMNVRAMKDQAHVWSMKKVTDENGDEGFENQAHNVYGPALITMYGSFSDEATDSRCITFDLFGKEISELREKGIPRRLSAEWHRGAERIRNMSLHWRLKNWQPDLDIPEELEDETVSTRANQVTVPIKYIVKDDPIALQEVTETVREMYADEMVQRAQSFEARFIEAIVALTETSRFDILDFVHEAEVKEFGRSKYIRYPDLALVTNFILDEMNTGISKDVSVIVKKALGAPEEDEDKPKDKDGKKKKKKEDGGISTQTVGNQMRKFQLPVHRLGRGYVVLVWSQNNPRDVQERIGRLKKRFGLDSLYEMKEESVVLSENALPVPQDDEQMELYAEMADEYDEPDEPDEPFLEGNRQ
jgi:hypothetical protein